MDRDMNGGLRPARRAPRQTQLLDARVVAGPARLEQLVVLRLEVQRHRLGGELGVAVIARPLLIQLRAQEAARRLPDGGLLGARGVVGGRGRTMLD